MEWKDITIAIFSLLTIIGGVFTFFFNWRKGKNDNLLASNVDIVKAAIGDSQAFRVEQRAEITGLKFDVKDLRENIEKQDLEILGLKGQVAHLEWEKKVLISERAADEVEKNRILTAKNSEIESLKMRIGVLEGTVEELKNGRS